MTRFDPQTPSGHRCPDDETFAELFDGVLTPAEQDVLYGAIAGCSACRETLALIGTTLADEPPELPPMPPPLLARIKARVLPPAADQPSPWAIAARLIDGVLTALGDALIPLPSPALATRGAGLDGGLRYEVELGGAPVELVLAGAGPDGILTARPLQTPPPRTRLVLMRGGEICASLAFDRDGVTLPALAPGHYLLRLEIPGRPAAELPLRLEG